MLDEDEFELVMERRMEGKSVLALEDVPASIERMLDEYNRITGFGETNVNAVWHHRLSLYGPPCAVCSKPLRSPRARRCAECGSLRQVSIPE